MNRLFWNLIWPSLASAKMEHLEALDGNDLYEPTVLDVLVVRAMINKAFGLAPELVDAVIDAAEYWPHSTVIGDYRQLQGGMKAAVGSSSRGSKNLFLARSQPLGFARHPAGADPQAWAEEEPKPIQLQKEHPREKLQDLAKCPLTLVEHPCRKIVFTIHSRDQGWGGNVQDHGTYKSSFTWFDAGLERFEAGDGVSASAPALDASELRSIWPEVRTNEQGEQYIHADLLSDPEHLVQFNLLAAARVMKHRVEWSYLDDIDPQSTEAAESLERVGRGTNSVDGKFVRSLKLGDVVTLWARARFAGWQNRVQRVQMDVYWVV
ncbi:hypothetical protein QBC33DRAFT_549332 [Phialemonium atrogriseum]|uniref:Uncharacterized protein n=1 Tax=Phialemonium atrogriseum TaxID=1093897 RepID=A0AAJ0BUY1_9PEZI|nr:uncharacterized protein QBC33DRAFT_549332 [Phialemonium atrogriseum]KAK1763564.1 hypothetical protein QBC33DRAFT_549332 [Phialemonium atrogriseum]